MAAFGGAGWLLRLAGGVVRPSIIAFGQQALADPNKSALCARACRIAEPG